MTREAFIKALERNRYSYEVVGDKIVVTHDGYLHLGSLQTIPPGVEFKNEGAVYLDSLQTIPPGVKFKNRGAVWLKSLIGFWFSEWEGNIEGISTKSLLNKMIEDGLFDRR